MKNENIGRMVASIINNDKDEFSDSFSAEIRDRIASNISDDTLEVSKNLLHPNEEEIEEAKNTPSQYKFRTPSDANKFINAALNSGISKKNISVKGKVVIVSKLTRDMAEIIQLLAKDMVK
tara:strand:- start:1220 stop:1582 length:363 start_codon:yes stop_codon:yes gene_type:complete